jgi:hypothetical protein
MLRFRAPLRSLGTSMRGIRLVRPNVVFCWLSAHGGYQVLGCPIGLSTNR